MRKALATIFVVLLVATHSISGQTFSDARTYEPVVLLGDSIPGLIGKATDQIFGYAYDAGSGTWQQIPFQVDERQWVDFSTKKLPASEYRYFEDEGNGFDGDDELAFMIEDLGDKAPFDSWVGGTDNTRYEVKITDPNDNSTGYLYIYTSATLSYTGPSYVTYNRVVTGEFTENTDITTDIWEGKYTMNWVFENLRLKNKARLIDRYKYRVYSLNEADNETEEYWSTDGRSTYIGHVTGPVRAIRMVEGAASGYVTTYQTEFYRKMQRMRVYYRTHGVARLWTYVDYMPGLAQVDTFNMQRPGSDFMTVWGQVSTAEGSHLVWADVSELAVNSVISSMYYKHDPGFDDGTGADGQAIHNHGTYHQRISSLDRGTPAIVTTNYYYMPANQPDRGQEFVSINENPVSKTITQQNNGSPPPNSPPVAAASATPTSGTAPLTVAFSSDGSSDSDGSITSYAWDFGDGTNSNEANPSYTYNSAGTYTATLTVTDDDGATDTDQVTITVTEPGANQPPNAVASATPTSGTAPLTVNFTGDQSSDPDGTISSYDWDFGDGTTATVANPTHTYNSAGTYTAVLTVTDDGGATDTAQVVITVNAAANQPPTATITEPAEGATFAVGQTVTYSGTGTDPEDGDLPASAFSWSVIGPDGKTVALGSGSKSGSGVPTYPGAYTLILTVEDSQGLTDEDRVNFTVTAAKIAASELAAAAGGKSFIDDIQSSGHTLFPAYPNPFNPETRVRFSLSETAKVTLSIYSVLGREVVRLIDGENLPAGLHDYRWNGRAADNSALPSGVYYIKLHVRDQVSLQKVIMMK